MTANSSIAVAFLFFSDGNEWHGGKNYFRGLFGALEIDSACKLRAVAVIGRRADTTGFGFPASVTFVRSSTLDRGSPSWFLDRVCKRLFGCTPLLRRDLARVNVRVVSHSDPRDSGNFPTIAWIPDFQHVHLPHFFEPAEIVRRNAEFKLLLDLSDLVVVSSHAARHDLENFSPENAHKARVLQFCAVRPELAVDEGDDLAALYGLADRFFYLPSQLWAHKNHRLAVEALAQVRSRWPLAQIVCSGALSDYRNPTHIQALQARITELGLQDSFKLLGLIPYDHIVRLMQRSVAVINPSYFEGWSTTVEEAKAIGTPLLLSDLVVHREQCPSGEALFFSPDDSAALAQRMEHVLGGDWPQASTDRKGVALSQYKNRALAFARTYQAIVEELA